MKTKTFALIALMLICSLTSFAQRYKRSIDEMPPDDQPVVAPIISAPKNSPASTQFVDWAAPVITSGSATLLAEGGLDIGGYVQITSQTAFTLTAAGVCVEWEVPANGVMVEYVSLFPEGSYGYSGDYAFLWHVKQPPEDPLTWYAYPEGWQGGAQNAYRRRIVPGDRLGILIKSSGAVEYYVNKGGPCSLPVFTSSRPVQPALRYFAFAFSVGGPGGVRRTTWQ